MRKKKSQGFQNVLLHQNNINFEWVLNDGLFGVMFPGQKRVISSSDSWMAGSTFPSPHPNTKLIIDCLNVTLCLPNKTYQLQWLNFVNFCYWLKVTICWLTRTFNIKTGIYKFTRRKCDFLWSNESRGLQLC